MKRIGLISDTHSFLHPKVFEFFKECDEIWHAGDIGNINVLDELSRFKPIRAVYGNIDGQEIKSYAQKINDLAVKVLMFGLRTSEGTLIGMHLM